VWFGRNIELMAMRVLVVTQYFWPENFRINDLVAEFVKRGHQVTVLTGLPNYPDGEVFPQFRAAPSRFSQFEGAEVVRVPLTPRGKGGLQLMLNYLTFALSASILGLWKLRGRQFDVIFTCQLSPVTVGIPAAVLRAIKRAPMAFWVLDLWPATLYAVGVVRSPVLLGLVGKLVAFIYQRCDLILAQSKSFIPEIQKYAGAGRQITYFPSWAEQVFNTQDVEPASEISMGAGSFNVMFAGNIGESQDFPAILAAADLLKDRPDIRWLIVGDGRLSRWVSDEIKVRELQECVLMLGRYPVDRMPSFFKHADALLVSLKDSPIFAMTIPGKLQSYLAAGVPIVAMLNGEGAELVASSSSGLTCSAGDSRGLAAAVLALSEMTNKDRVAMGRNGVNVSFREFHRETLMNQLETWLEKLKRKDHPCEDNIAIAFNQHKAIVADRSYLSVFRSFRALQPGIAHGKRIFDLLLSLCALGMLFFPIVLIAAAVCLTSAGPALYWSERVGRNNKLFKMPKFRSMRIGTPAVATHLLEDPATYLTPIGSFLRKSSLDELPQLLSILAGDMSFVGPRPALFNQHDLIALRTQQGVDRLVPGLTGWAQVNGRDELPIPDKVKLDVQYLERQSLVFDLRILWMTFIKVLRRDGVAH
jgi:colanic acid biosynthesis glycosyl transferase WcaI